MFDVIITNTYCLCLFVCLFIFVGVFVVVVVVVVVGVVVVFVSGLWIGVFFCFYYFIFFGGGGGGGLLGFWGFLRWLWTFFCVCVCVCVCVRAYFVRALYFCEVLLLSLLFCCSFHIFNFFL